MVKSIFLFGHLTPFKFHKLFTE